MKHVLRYLEGATELGLCSGKINHAYLDIYTNADWSMECTDRKSNSLD